LDVAASRIALWHIGENSHKVSDMKPSFTRGFRDFHAFPSLFSLVPTYSLEFTFECLQRMTYRVSSISAMKDDTPRTWLSLAPTRAKILSTTVHSKLEAGTKLPTWASSTPTPTLLGLHRKSTQRPTLVMMRERKPETATPGVNEIGFKLSLM
jgi:hypothetical protein